MKNYTITVNGNVYDVTVEETGSTPSTASTPRRAAAPAAAAPKAAAPAGAGSIKVEAGAAGKVFKLEAKVGDAVKKGDTLLILEIMKMFILNVRFTHVPHSFAALTHFTVSSFQIF